MRCQAYLGRKKIDALLWYKIDNFHFKYYLIQVVCLSLEEKIF